MNNLDEQNQYDMILVDVYSGKSLPPQVITQEFFEKILYHGDTVFLNIITDVYRETQFSKNLFSTLAISWPEVYFFNTNKMSEYKMTNFIVTNKNFEWYFQNGITQWNIYTDNLNSIEKDSFLLDNYEYKK